MFERNEKWIILGVIALVIYYLYKKGMAANTLPAPYLSVSSAGDGIAQGSWVNTFLEPGTVQPAQGSTPTIFPPAQPATVPQSQIVSRGVMTYNPITPVLRVTPTGGYSYRIQ